VGEGFRGSPVATSHPENGIRDVFALRNTGDLWHEWAWSTGPWAGGESLGGSFIGSPFAIVSSVSGYREVFVTSADGRIEHDWAPPVGGFIGFDSL
jgi:hypothetical protein